MDIRDKPFRDRFFLWALSDTAAQHHAGLPLLTSVQGEMPRKTLAFLEGLSSEQQRLLLNGGVKKAFGHAYSEASGLLSGLRQHLLVFSEDEPKSPPIRKSKLKAAVLREFEAEMGKKGEKWGPHEIKFSKQIGNGEIETIIDFGGRSQMRYEHKIKDCHGNYVAEFVDLQAWMGLGHTAWNELREGDEQQGAESLLAICKHFLRAANGLMLSSH